MKTACLCLALLAAAPVAAQQQPMRIVDEGKLDGVQVTAVAGELPAPVYPTAYADSGDDVCIAMAYTIEPDGSTGDFRVLRAWSSNSSNLETNAKYSDAFVLAAAETVAQWRFAHQGDNTSPVGTVATLSFEGKGSTRRLADRCRIRQLANYYKAVGNIELARLKAADRAGADARYQAGVAESNTAWLQDQSANGYCHR